MMAVRVDLVALLLICAVSTDLVLFEVSSIASVEEDAEQNSEFADFFADTDVYDVSASGETAILKESPHGSPNSRRRDEDNMDDDHDTVVSVQEKFRRQKIRDFSLWDPFIDRVLDLGRREGDGVRDFFLRDRNPNIAQCAEHFLPDAPSVWAVLRPHHSFTIARSTRTKTETKADLLTATRRAENESSLPLSQLGAQDVLRRKVDIFWSECCDWEEVEAGQPKYSRCFRKFRRSTPANYCCLDHLKGFYGFLLPRVHAYPSGHSSYTSTSSPSSYSEYWKEEQSVSMITATNAQESTDHDLAELRYLSEVWRKYRRDPQRGFLPVEFPSEQSDRIPKPEAAAKSAVTSPFYEWEVARASQDERAVRVFSNPPSVFDSDIFFDISGVAVDQVFSPAPAGWPFVRSFVRQTQNLTSKGRVFDVVGFNFAHDYAELPSMVATEVARLFDFSQSLRNSLSISDVATESAKLSLKPDFHEFWEERRRHDSGLLPCDQRFLVTVYLTMTKSPRFRLRHPDTYFVLRRNQLSNRLLTTGRQATQRDFTFALMDEMLGSARCLRALSRPESEHDARWCMSRLEAEHARSGYAWKTLQQLEDTIQAVFRQDTAEVLQHVHGAIQNRASSAASVFELAEQLLVGSPPSPTSESATAAAESNIARAELADLVTIEAILILFNALLYLRTGREIGRFINLGARDGVTEDPLAALFWYGINRIEFGLAIEANEAECEMHRGYYQENPRLEVLCGVMTPRNIEASVYSRIPADVREHMARTSKWHTQTRNTREKNNTSSPTERESARKLLSSGSTVRVLVERMLSSDGIAEEPQMDTTEDDMPYLDVIKVDIDSLDCPLLEELLKSKRLGGGAKLVVTEVFDGVPPPFEFSQQYDPEISERVYNLEGIKKHQQGYSGGMPKPWGCNLQYQTTMLRKYGYELVWYAVGNAVFVHETVFRHGLPHGWPRGGLDEMDCYRESPIVAMWPERERLRKWFLGCSVEDALTEMRAAIPASWASTHGEIASQMPFHLAV